MATITKKDLIDRIAGSTPVKRAHVRKIVQLFLDMVADELAAQNRLEFREFGVFEVRARAPRTAQNPKTLERVRVPAKKTVKFKPGSALRLRIDPGSRTDASAVTVEIKSRRAGAAV
jgi:integration host factor subunit beta